MLDDELLDNEESVEIQRIFTTIVDSSYAKSILGQIASEKPWFQYEGCSYDAPISQDSCFFIVEVRLTRGFKDLQLLRDIRRQRPLTPIVVLSKNSDSDFLMELYKTGATDVVVEADHRILSEKLSLLSKLSESSKTLEVQNSQLVESMKRQRLEHEKIVQMEKAKSEAEASAKNNAQLKEIFDHLKEGFFSVDQQLLVQEGVSKACHCLFDGDIAGGKIGNNILRLEAGSEEHIGHSMQQLFDNVMPLNVNLALLPKKVRTAKGASLELDYSVILEQSEPQKIIVVVSDVTENERNTRDLNCKIKKNMSLINILRNRDSFKLFIADTVEMLNGLKASVEKKKVQRALHTIKGNAASFQLHDIASLVHEQESLIGDKQDGPEDFGAVIETVEGAFKGFLDSNHTVLNIDYEGGGNNQFEIAESDLVSLEQQVRALALPSSSPIPDLLAQIRTKPASIIEDQLRNRVMNLASSSNKKIRFSLHGGDSRIDFKRLKPLINALIHPITNACDHGIETPEQRMEAGKSEEGKIKICFERGKSNELSIILVDDGRGIDLQQVASKAVKIGLYKEEELRELKQEQLYELLFSDDFSTSDSVSQTSGRGVGMSALKAEIEAVGGRYIIESQLGKGTTLKIYVS